MNQGIAVSVLVTLACRGGKPTMTERARVISVVAGGLATVIVLWFAMVMAIGFPWF
jgi:hypothetical protein